jgi:hypothetical protein
MKDKLEETTRKVNRILDVPTDESNHQTLLMSPKILDQLICDSEKM